MIPALEKLFRDAQPMIIIEESDYCCWEIVSSSIYYVAIRVRPGYAALLVTIRKYEN